MVATPKKSPGRSQAKSEQAAANTFPISNYFSPSRNKDAIPKGSSDRQISHQKRSNKNARSPHDDVDLNVDGKNLSNKRRKVGADKPSMEFLSVLRNGIGAVTSWATNKLDLSGASGKRAPLTIKDSSDSDDDILAFQPFVQKSIKPSEQPNPLPLLNSINVVQSDGINFGTAISKVRTSVPIPSKLKLGLVRVQADESISQICNSLETDPLTCTHYPLLEGNILGRDESRQRVNKISLGIPSSDSTISRRQLEVATILPPLEHSEFLTYNGSDMPSHYCEYLQQQQRSCPRIVLRSCGETVCDTTMWRLSINHEYFRKSQRGESCNHDLPVLEHDWDIGRGDSIVLSVGDAIEFDIHNRPNLLESLSLPMAINGETFFPPNSMPKGRYVYRLVAYIPENEGSLVNPEKANIMKAGPAEITPELPVSIRTKKLIEFQDDVSSESSVHPSIEDVTLASISVKDETSSECVNRSIEDGSLASISVEEEIDIQSSAAPLDWLAKDSWVPKVGDLFREPIEEAEDLFTQKNALWITGIIQNVQKKLNGEYLLKVLYCDKVEAEIIFPKNDFELLRPTAKTPLILWNEDDLFACDCNPKYLGIGDFVECFYQNGQNSGRWWQGRVAWIHLNECSIDVAYCDGDFECGIPLHRGYIRLLAKGSYDAKKWLVGATYCPKSNDGVLLDEVQVVDIFSNSEKAVPKQLTPYEDWSSHLCCKMRTLDGDDLMSYESVVIQLFSRLKAESRNAGIIKMWPAKDSVNLLETSEMSKQYLFTAEEEKGVAPSMIMPTVTNSCLRACNSSECDEGFAALIHADSTWNCLPNKKLITFLLRFMVNGPEHEGSELRTEFAFKYMKRIHLRSCDNEDSQPTFDEIKRILEAPMRRHEVDIPGRRLFQTLHFCSQSLSALATVISFGLQDVLSGKVKLTSDAGDRIPILGHLIRANVRDCLKSAVKCAVQTWLHHGFWLLGNPGERRRPHKTANEQTCANQFHALVKAYGTIVSHLACLFCVEEAIPLGNEQCCFIMYDVLNCELERTDAFKLTSAIGKTRITSTEFNAFKRNLKLRFVLSLSTGFSRDLQLQLSRLLDLECEVSLVLG